MSFAVVLNLGRGFWQDFMDLGLIVAGQDRCGAPFCHIRVLLWMFQMRMKEFGVCAAVSGWPLVLPFREGQNGRRQAVSSGSQHRVSAHLCNCGGYWGCGVLVLGRCGDGVILFHPPSPFLFKLTKQGRQPQGHALS
jgi:hypothetical protein